MKIPSRCVSIPLLLLFCVGCSGTAIVSGTVTYEGKAVDRGKISFLPLDESGQLDGKGIIVGVDIAGGKYTAKDVPYGKKRVAVIAFALDGKSGHAAEPLIPPDVSDQTTLEINKPNLTADIAWKKPETKPEADKK